MTNVPQPQFTANGFIAPAQSAILTGVTEDYNAAFGGNLNPALNTPQGQLATSTASIVGNTNDLFVYYTNQTDPAYASGRMQDALGRIYFIERLPAQPTVIQVNCLGLVNVVIPIGALVIDGSQNVYTCTGSATIGPGGSVPASFSCNTSGPITVPSSVTVYQAIPGWDSVSVISGVEGQNVESRTAFELRRQQSVAQNAVGSIPAVLGSILSVPGVLDAYVTDNTSNGTVTVNGTVLAAHSLYAAVYGGASSAVATAIWQKKMPGCAMNGNTTVTVTDTNSGYSAPLPTYQIQFEIPPPLPIIFSVSLAANSQVPANAASLVQQAILSAFAGGDGGPRARIGSIIYASRFYAPIAALGSWVQIKTILIGSPNSAAAVFTGSIGGSSGGTSTSLVVTSVMSGTLGAGQTLTDGTAGLITIGTQILSQVSGTVGGTGVYLVSVAQNVPTETLTSVNPTLTQLTVQINQEPVTAAGDIYVNTS